MNVNDCLNVFNDLKDDLEEKVPKHMASRCFYFLMDHKLITSYILDSYDFVY